jgi:microcompartment protein CcmL/EutN
LPSSALGLVEVRSLTYAIEAVNTAVNAASVDLAGTSYALPGVVLVALRGSVDSVVVAVDAIRGRLDPLGMVHGHSVIARPDESIDELLAGRFVPIGARAGAPAILGRGRMHDAGGVPTAVEEPTAAAAPPRKRVTAKKRAAKKSTELRKPTTGPDT